MADSIYSLGGGGSTTGFSLADYTGLPASVSGGVVAPYDVSPLPSWLNNLAGVATTGLSRYLDTENQIKLSQATTANLFNPAAAAAAQAAAGAAGTAPAANSDLMLLAIVGAVIFLVMS